MLKLESASDRGAHAASADYGIYTVGNCVIPSAFHFNSFLDCRHSEGPEPLVISDRPSPRPRFGRGMAILPRPRPKDSFLGVPRPR